MAGRKQGTQSHRKETARSRWQGEEPPRRQSAKKRRPAETPSRPSRSMIQATICGRLHRKASSPKKAAHTRRTGKETGGDKRKAHQQTEGSRAKNRRASKARRSGARRKSQQPHKHKHDPSYSVGGIWGRDGEQTSIRLLKQQNCEAHKQTEGCRAKNRRAG